MTTDNHTNRDEPRETRPPASDAPAGPEAKPHLKTYTILFAEDIPHYGSIEIEAAGDDDAIALARAKSYDELDEITINPAWDDPVCRRIVHIEDEAGTFVAEQIALDGYVLHHESERRARLCAVAGKLFEALKRIAETPLWGEAVTDAGLRDELIFSGEYDVGLDEYQPSADTESDALREAVEIARAAIARLDGGS